MNNLDIALLVGAGIFVVLGVYWGLIRQVLSIVGLLVGVALAGRYGPEVALWLSSFIEEPAIAGALGFLGVLLLVSAVASLVASALRIFAGLLFLGWLDHLLGGALGLLQAALAGTAVLVGLVAFPSPAWADLVAGSALAGGLLRVSAPLTAMLPDFFSSAVRVALGG